MPRPELGDRMKKLIERADVLFREKRRMQYASNLESFVHVWSPSTVRRSSTGTGLSKSEVVSLGDFLCRVGVDYPFPQQDFPSKAKGPSWDPENWADDYAHLLRYSPAEIYPFERVVGEFHWCLEDFREIKYPAELDPLGYAARDAGSGGVVFTHNCPDLTIGLTKGWGTIRDDIRQHREKFRAAGDEEKVCYLNAAETVCNAIIGFVRSHSRKAYSLAENEADQVREREYVRIAEVCDNISEKPPQDFREAVQWIWFFVMVDRMMGHANGYGRLDQVLKPFYEADRAKGRLAREEARDLVAELLLKYTGTFFSLGGRDGELKDATSDLSRVCLEAYDMIGGMQTMGVLWHKEIDRNFFAYACEVAARHGAGVPALLNHDVMIESELYSGYRKEDAWNVSYSGCQWYCVPGKENSSHDTTHVSIIRCLKDALEDATDASTFEMLWEAYCRRVDNAINALVHSVNAQSRLQPYVWPEIPTSLLHHGCMQKGKDLTNCGVDYNFNSVNLKGLANVADSLYAIKKLVLEQKKISLSELKKALKADFVGYEEMRQLLLNVPKYGNDDGEVDAVARMVVDQAKENLRKYRNWKGFYYRPSIMSWMQHAFPLGIGATPDGRKADEPLAHNANPMHGRNREGVTATARSIAKLGHNELQGGPWNLELERSELGHNPEKTIEALATGFFELGGLHININIYDTEILRKAVEHPEQYGHIVVRVTGQSAHFVLLDRKIQEEIIARTRFGLSRSH